MAEIADLSVTDASNTGRFPEGQNPSTVNNGARALEGMIARFVVDAVETNITSTGSANAYVVAANRTLTAYYAGLRIAFKTNFTNSGAATVNVDALGAKNIYKKTSAGVAALASGDIQSGDIVDLIYDGTQFQMLSALPPAVGAAANTFTGTQTLSGAAVNEAKGSDIASATTTDIGAATGNFVDVTGTTTITGLGTVQAGARRTVRFTGALTLTHNATSLILPTAANITTVANDRATFLSLGSGNWICVDYVRASGASLYGGKVVQIVSFQTGAVATGTTIIPFDDTIPQNTEGDQYMTCAITPTSATNKLRIDVVVNLGNSVSTAALAAALFQDTTAGALAVGSTQLESAGGRRQIVFSHVLDAGTTSATTFKVRCGAHTASTTTFNGSGGVRDFGGVVASSIRITEYVP